MSLLPFSSQLIADVGISLGDEGKGRLIPEIANELRSQYSIGYYPTHPLQDGKWHRISISAKNPHYHVRARKEYYGK